MTVKKIFIRFRKNIESFFNEINKRAGWIFVLFRVEFSKIGKCDVTFIREMRVHKLIYSQTIFLKSNSMQMHKLSNPNLDYRHSVAKLRAKTEAGDKELRALRRK